MKKKIAVFANGWSTEFLRLVLDGIRKRAFELNMDVFLYIGYAVGVRGEQFSEGESTIYRLPEISEYDGVILLPGTFNSEKAVDELCERVKQSKVPAISIEYQIDGIDYIGTENFNASYTVAKHLVDVHNSKNFIFMGGPADNRDSRERLSGVKKALDEVNITIPEDCILNGYYAYKPSRNVIKQWLDEHSYIPDAIVCANDDMAIGVCSQLAEMGIDVPNDVVVTGYDGLKAGQRFMPTITSVHRSWSKIGASAVDNIVDKINGRITKSFVLMDTRPVYKESCGCRDAFKNEKFIHDVREVIVNDHTESLERVLTLELISTVCDAFVSTEDFDQMSSTVKKVLDSSDKLLGNVIKLYLNESFLDCENQEIQTEKYDDHLYCVCDVDASGAKAIHKIERKQFARDLSETVGEHHFFIVLPVQKLGKIYGVIVFDECLKYIYDYSFSSIEDNVDSAVEQIRQAMELKAANRQLQDLSERDNLTGIYNRVAYDKYAMPLLDRLKRENKEAMLVIVDIDKMKIINDRYGHLQGDVAIKVVANVITEVLPKDWVTIRYGGDEFLAIGEYEDGMNGESIVAEINERILSIKEKQKIPFVLSVSAGAKRIAPSDEGDILYHFKKADESMYIMKEDHHNRLIADGTIEA